MNLHSRRLTIATIVAACTLLLGFALPASAQRPNTQPPIIVTAVGDQVANTLTINGANFFAPATIMLGSIGPLTVTTHTAAQIVATLPPGTPAGSYLLTLTQTGGIEEFWVTLGTQGLPGPQGPTGATGAT